MFLVRYTKEDDHRFCVDEHTGFVIVDSINEIVSYASTMTGKKLSFEKDFKEIDTMHYEYAPCDGTYLEAQWVEKRVIYKDEV